MKRVWVEDGGGAVFVVLEEQGENVKLAWEGDEDLMTFWMKKELVHEK